MNPLNHKSSLTPRRALLCAAAIAVMALPALASAKIFVAGDGISGESTAAGFTGQIEAESVSFGYSSPPITAGAMNGARTVLSPVTISKRVDKTTAVLMSTGGAGKVFSNLVISSVRADGDANSLVYSVTLTNALISDWRLVESSAGAFEQVSFTPASIAISYAHRDPGGKITPITGTVGTK